MVTEYLNIPYDEYALNDQEITEIENCAAELYVRLVNKVASLGLTMTDFVITKFTQEELDTMPIAKDHVEILPCQLPHSIETPVQIGDILYSIVGCAENPQAFEVSRIQLTKEYGLEFGAYSRNQTYRVFTPDLIGKEIFLTMDEAKEALKTKQ
jgi:hypothetical protein